MQDKNRIWSDCREGRSTAADVMAGLDDQNNVQEEATRQGVVYTGNCSRCGAQWKMVAKWVEFAGWFLGQAVPDSTPMRDGVTTQPRCRCGQPQVFIITWPEVKNYVEIAVRASALPQSILNLRPIQPQRR